MRQCSARTFTTGVGFSRVSAGPKVETRSANAPLGVPDDALARSCSIDDAFDDDDDDDAVAGSVAEEEDESFVVVDEDFLDADDGRDSK